MQLCEVTEKNILTNTNLSGGGITSLKPGSQNPLSLKTMTVTTVPDEISLEELLSGLMRLPNHKTKYPNKYEQKTEVRVISNVKGDEVSSECLHYHLSQYGTAREQLTTYIKDKGTESSKSKPTSGDALTLHQSYSVNSENRPRRLSTPQPEVVDASETAVIFNRNSRSTTAHQRRTSGSQGQF
ncbi:uncharacterized protein LOC134848303 [Symsagittifera roscoffensis]|uniref:uncharacterized protein LOC134848303 n=1 Tax=Symsagittifera roscoffensis TaxID=84072 RepID=UPI00307BB867